MLTRLLLALSLLVPVAASAAEPQVVEQVTPSKKRPTVTAPGTIQTATEVIQKPVVDPRPPLAAKPAPIVVREAVQASTPRPVALPGSVPALPKPTKGLTAPSPGPAPIDPKAIDKATNPVAAP